MNISTLDNLHDLGYNYMDIPVMDIDHGVFYNILHGVEYDLDKTLLRMEDTIITTSRINEYGHTFFT